MDTQQLSWERRPEGAGFVEWITVDSPEAAAAVQRQRERVLRDRGAGIALSDIEPADDGRALLTICWALVPPNRPATGTPVPSVELNNGTVEGQVRRLLTADPEAPTARDGFVTRQITLAGDVDDAIYELAYEVGALTRTGEHAGFASIEALLTMIARRELVIGWPEDRPDAD